MSFFDSEVVRSEMVKISELQEEVYRNFYKFPTMSIEDKISHVDKVESLLDKQRILYTRLSLSEDPAAQQMKDQIIQAARGIGLPPDVDMSVLFKNMHDTVVQMRKNIDKSRSEL